MSFYFDTSALVPLFVPEPSSERLAALTAALTRRPLLSDFGAGEFASVISRQVRERRYDQAAGRAILAGFDRWSARSAELLDLASADLRRANAIVRRFELKLRFPDALHTAICLERALSVVTRDRALAAAAEQFGLAVELLD